MLTRAEKMLAADALNGCYLGLDDPASGMLGMLCGSEGALADATVQGATEDGRVALAGRLMSGLEMELADAIRLDGLDRKWAVDGPALLAKVRTMTVADRERLVRRIAECWARNDESFERDLEALEV